MRYLRRAQALAALTRRGATAKPPRRRNLGQCRAPLRCFALGAGPEEAGASARQQGDRSRVFLRLYHAGAGMCGCGGMVDATDSNSVSARSVGSSPTTRTTSQYGLFCGEAPSGARLIRPLPRLTVAWVEMMISQSQDWPRPGNSAPKMWRPNGRKMKQG